MHTPVLTKEVLENLDVKKGQTVVDATFGQGGHARAILPLITGSTLQPHHSTTIKSKPCACGQHRLFSSPLVDSPQKEQTPRLIGIDRDAEAIDQATHSLASAIDRQELILIQGRFSELTDILQGLSRPQVDGVLMDLGVSSNQILSSTRGFSFTYPKAPLDMRMDKREDLTARRILAEWSKEELRDLFFLAGERRYAKALARQIIKQRSQNKIETSGDLQELIKKIIPLNTRGVYRRNVATRVFMALRIAVNHELEELEQGLDSALIALKPGGRLVVITFNSLEDKIVKQKFRNWAASCVCPPELPVCRCHHNPLVNILTAKPITPNVRELSSNPRARSGKLRAIKKL